MARAGRRFLLRPTRLRYVRIPANPPPPTIYPDFIAATSTVFDPLPLLLPTTVPTTTTVFSPTISTTPDIYPPGPITGLTVTPEGLNALRLEWTNPTDFDFDHVVIMRSKTLPYAELSWPIIGDIVRIEPGNGAAPEDTLTRETATWITPGTFTDTQDITGRAQNSPRTTRGAWYRYKPTTSGTITIDTVGTTPLDTYIYVVDETGTSVLAADDDTGSAHGGSSTSSWLQYAVTAGVTYYICPCSYGTAGSGNIVFNFSGPTGEARPPSPIEYFDYSLESGITYYYKVFTYDDAGNTNAAVGVTGSDTTGLLDDPDPIPITVAMPAGTFSLLPGTPIPAPTPSSVDITWTARDLDLRVTMLEGAFWVKDLLQLPPVRPGTLPPVPVDGVSFGPEFTQTPTDITVEIWDQTNTNLLGTLDYSASRQFLDEYNGVGSGTLKVPLGHESASLFKRDRVLRFYYKDIPDAVFASIIEQRKNGVIAEAGSQWSEVSGRGTLAWLEDAVVLPYLPPVPGLARASGYTILPGENQPRVPRYSTAYDPTYISPNAPDVRAFNFCSRDAYEHNLIDDEGPGTFFGPDGPGWHNSGGYLQSDVGPNNKKKYKPESWPDPGAFWIWGANPIMNRPVDELCWFRIQVYIAQTGTYRIFCTGDNAFMMWVDGIELASSGLEDAYTAGWKVSSEVDVDLEAGPHVFAMRGQNAPPRPGQENSSNPAGVIFTMMTLDANSKPLAVVPLVHTGTIGRLENNRWMANWSGPAWKAGDVLHTLVTEAQARAVTRLQHVTMDFDKENDSHGQPWTTRVSRTWDIGTNLLSVAFDLCELGVDIWMTADNVLHCAERRGSNTPTFTVKYGQNVSGYDTEETYGGASVAYTRTRAGWMRLEDVTSNIILGGVRETGISVANTDSEDQAIGVSHRAIGAVVMSSILATAESIVPVAGSVPYTDVEISDIIYVLSPNGRQRMGRLLSIAMSENEAGSTLWAPEIEIWSSPFGDGVDPNAPQDPVNPDDPFDSSTWVPAADDWFRFIPLGDGANGDYPKAVTLPPSGAGGSNGASPSPSGGTPRPRSSSQSPRPPYNSRNDRTPPNAERIAIQSTPPLTTAGYLLWVDTSGLV